MAPRRSNLIIQEPIPGLTLNHNPSAKSNLQWHSENSLCVVLAGHLTSIHGQEGPPQRLFQLLCTSIQNRNLRLRDLNGSFVLFILKREGNELEVSAVTDRMGTYHAYWGQKSGRLAVGTSFKQVVDVLGASDWNWPALEEFTATSFFINIQTHMREIEILPAACQKTWTFAVTPEGGHSLVRESQSRYWNWYYQPESQSLSESLERYHGVLQRSLACCSLEEGETLGLGVSGGLDSRNLLGALSGDQGVKLFSYGYEKESQELKIAGQLAAAAGAPLAQWICKDNLLEALGDHIPFSEGFSDVTQTRQIGVMENIGGHCDALLMGQWGDVFHDSAGANHQTGLSPSDLAAVAMKKYFKTGSEMVFSLLPNAPPKEEIRARIHAYLETEIRGYGELNPEMGLKALKTWQWSFRNTMVGIRVFRLAARPFLPFYDNEMVDFFCTVPHSHVNDRKLQIEWIKKYSPELARVPWQETGRNLHWTRRQAHWANLPQRAVSKAMRRFFPNRHSRNWERQFKHRYSELEAYLLERNREQGAGTLSPALIRARVKALQENPNAGNGYAVSILFSLLAALAWLKPRT